VYNKREELSDELKETPKIIFGIVPSTNSNLNQIAPSGSLGLNLLHSLADSTQSSVNSSIDFSDFVTTPTVATSLDIGGSITSITDVSQPRCATEVFIPQTTLCDGMVLDQAENLDAPLLQRSERTNNAICAAGISAANEDITQKAMKRMAWKNLDGEPRSHLASPKSPSTPNITLQKNPPSGHYLMIDAFLD
jgi:hypothetical protein